MSMAELASAAPTSGGVSPCYYTSPGSGLLDILMTLRHLALLLDTFPFVSAMEESPSLDRRL
jgi:hypothetical protein